MNIRLQLDIAALWIHVMGESWQETPRNEALLARALERAGRGNQAMSGEGEATEPDSDDERTRVLANLIVATRKAHEASLAAPNPTPVKVTIEAVNLMWLYWSFTTRDDTPRDDLLLAMARDAIARGVDDAHAIHADRSITWADVFEQVRRVNDGGGNAFLYGLALDLAATPGLAASTVSRGDIHLADSEEVALVGGVPVPVGYEINRKHAADVLMDSQALQLDTNLHGDPPPTRNQVAAVLHGLANFGQTQHMLSPEVEALGADKRPLHGDDFARATGLGRYFRGLGNWLETFPPEPERLED